jgi:hypothetical protein
MAMRQIPESGSRRLSEFSFKHSKAESATPRRGESFFDYEYLREIEAKIGTAGKVV